jgi:AraC-like DNA-binding protein
MTVGDIAPASNGKAPRETTVAAGIVQALLEFAISKGAPEAALRGRSGLGVCDLSDRDNRIPFANYLALMRAGKELCADPALALHFGEATECSKYSVLGLICASCETVADSFVQGNRYARLAVDFDLADDRFGMAPAPGGFWIVDNRPDPNDSPEMTETWIAGMLTSVRRLSDKPAVRQIEVTHAEPGHRADYDRILAVPIAFGSKRNAVLFEQWWLTHRLEGASGYAFGVLSEHADALLGELEAAKTVRGRVEAILLPLLHLGDVSMDAVAAQMRISRQTLYRKLKDEGVTFDAVLDRLRHRLALHYLDGKKVSVNETAYLVGFSDATAFSRAFKRWTGASPRRRPLPASP